MRHRRIVRKGSDLRSSHTEVYDFFLAQVGLTAHLAVRPPPSDHRGVEVATMVFKNMIEREDWRKGFYYAEARGIDIDEIWGKVGRPRWEELENSRLGYRGPAYFASMIYELRRKRLPAAFPNVTTISERWGE